MAEVPRGIGIMVMAADHTEIHNNTIRNNESTGVIVLDFRAQNANATLPPTYDPKPEDTCIHDNTFTDNGTNPAGPIALLGEPPSPDIIYDGFRDNSNGGCVTNAVNQMCVRNNAGARFLLEHDVTTSGRHPDSDIFLDDVTVSRRHAEFHRGSGGFTVRDVGSLNGTYVNRERVESATLSSGDELQIGKFRLVFIAGPRVGDAT